MAVTRKTIRRTVIFDLGDMIICEATADGSDVFFYDTKNLTAPANGYIARQVLFTGPADSPNLGEQRYISQSSAANRGIAWGVALPAETQLGDECELLDERGVRFKFQQVHQAINNSIRSVARQALFPVAPITVDFTYGTAIEIPENWISVEWVRRLDVCDENAMRVVPISRRPYGNGWWVDSSSRQIWITGEEGRCHTGASIKIWGLGSHAEVFDDLDPIYLDEQWLVNSVKARMMLGRHIKTPMPELERTMYGLQQNEAVSHPGAITNRGPFSVLI